MGEKHLKIWDAHGIGAQLQNSDTDEVTGRERAFGVLSGWNILIFGRPGELLVLRSERELAFGCEGNGTPLQYSCLENPMNGGAW